MLFVAVLSASGACAGSEAPAGAGGAPGSGGAQGSGGALGSGGVQGSGGALGSGGLTATGGTSASGGAPGTGGAAAGTGGAQGTIMRVNLTGKKALMVVDDPSSLDDGDLAFRDVLVNRGMVVTFGDVTTAAAGAATMNLIVASSGASETEFAPLYGAVAVPMIAFGGGYFQPLNFAAAGSANKGGNVTGTTKVTIVDAATPLAASFPAGMALGVIGTTRSTQFYWGLPMGSPIKVAAVMGMPTQISVFAYEKGATMAVGTAPARRVALGWNTDAVPDLSIEAFRLMNSAIDWTAGATP
ncbi:MAG: hypothetical protein ABUS79_02705 [Pseudomonadota bacterium]